MRVPSELIIIVLWLIWGPKVPVPSTTMSELVVVIPSLPLESQSGVLDLK